MGAELSAVAARKPPHCVAACEAQSEDERRREGRRQSDGLLSATVQATCAVVMVVCFKYIAARSKPCRGHAPPFLELYPARRALFDGTSARHPPIFRLLFDWCTESDDFG